MALEFPPMEAYLWNPRQWQGSRKVQRMSWAERGLYRELMDECYLHGSIPGDVEGLAEMLGEDPATIAPLWEKVSRCFTPDPEAPEQMISVHIEEVRAAQDARRRSRSEAGRVGNAKRWATPPASPSCDGSDRKCDDPDRKCEECDRECDDVRSQTIASDREEGGRERVVTEVDSSLRSESPSSTTPGRPSPKRSRKKAAPGNPVLSLAIPDEVAAASNEILDACPRQDPDGRTIRRDPGLLAQRMEGIATQNAGTITLGLLVAAWKAYLASGPRAVKAPQYFFGRSEDQDGGGANWLPWARFVYRKLNPKPSPTPAPVPPPLAAATA